MLEALWCYTEAYCFELNANGSVLTCLRLLTKSQTCQMLVALWVKSVGSVENFMIIHLVVEIFQSGQSGGPTLHYCHTTSVTKEANVRPWNFVIKKKPLLGTWLIYETVKKSGFSGWREKDPRGPRSFRSILELKKNAVCIWKLGKAFELRTFWYTIKKLTDIIPWSSSGVNVGLVD